MRNVMRFTAVHFSLVSVLILLAFALGEGVQSLREVALPQMTSPLHAVFLPFGAMVLLTWVYGWMAVPLMLPGAVLAVGAIVGVSSLSLAVLLVLAAKVVAVPLSFDLFRRAGLDARGEGRAANWRVLMAVGLVAALIGNVPRVMAGPCCTGFSVLDRMAAYVTVTAADIGGLMLVLLGAMGLFRLLRHG
jgi:hypothetical protein